MNWNLIRARGIIAIGEMGTAARLIHRVQDACNLVGHRRYVASFHDLEAVQRSILQGYLAISANTEFGRATGLDASWSYERFKEKFPITDYSYWEGWVDRQREAGATRAILSPDCRRFEPTSGSTSRRKWIPYTGRLLREFDHAASAWLHELYLQYPKLRNGRHYWSLSWMPDDLRKEMGTTDDSKLFPWWKRLLLSQVMAVPCQVADFPLSAQSTLATLAWLAACDDLRLLSVWSPTFGLNLVSDLAANRQELVGILSKGRWSDSRMTEVEAPRSERAAAILRSWDGKQGPEITRELWPELTLVSSWDSSTSEPWAAKLRKLFGHAAFQGKGLWATEGVVTIPIEGDMPLAATSHFLEFRVLSDDSQPVIPSWKLRPGQVVQPILSTGSGFFRYALQDRMEVMKSFHGSSSLRFLGRLGGADLVGEKIDSTGAMQILESVAGELPLRCISFLADRANPRYVLLAEPDADRAGARPDARQVAEAVERRLLEFHHYKLARQLGQLAHAEAWIDPDALDIYRAHREQNGDGVHGSIKIEPVLICRAVAVKKPVPEKTPEVVT